MTRAWLAPALWAVFILVLTSLPGSAVPVVNITNIDKVVHFTLYATEGFLVMRALRRTHARGLLASAAIAIVGMSAFGAVDEWHQQFIPGRSQDRYDWMADTTGATLGVIIAARTLGRRESTS